MSTYILTSMFPNGFNGITAEVFRQKINRRDKFAFVASEFDKMHEKTDYYFHFFLNMFEAVGIHFENLKKIMDNLNVLSVSEKN